MAEVDINLTVNGDSVTEPWLWRISKEFNVSVNIIKASIDTDFGWVHMRLVGPIEEIQRATAWLMTTGMHVDAVQRSVKA
ncbi:MAG: NIL domain-containing protein [Armatimonadetes bacterium]|nr:NIL domain-containing protein [Armatimonadota bacterium]